MPRQVRTVGDYLKELRETRKDKPPQVKEALEIYLDLWEDAIENKSVDRDDDIDLALSKLDAKGGLYAAAQH